MGICDWLLSLVRSLLPGDVEEPTAPCEPGEEPEQPAPAEPTDKRVIQIEWVDAETWCSEERTVRGTTENYGDGERLTIQVQKADSGAAITSFEATVSGNRFQHTWEVINVLPPEQDGHKAEEMNVNAAAGGVTTPRPLKIKFVPNVAQRRCTTNTARVNVAAQDHRITISENAEYVKGWAGQVVKLGPAHSALGGEIAGFSWPGYRWMKQVASTHKYWDGSAWQDLPAGFTLANGNNFCVGFYVNGTTAGGATRYTSQYGGDWPETFTDWDIDAADKQATITSWAAAIDAKWTGKFDLRRADCASTETRCCRYPITVDASFTKRDAFGRGMLIIADGYIRSNSGLFFIGGRVASFPHEFGHWLNNRDEYDTPSATLIDDESIMGRNLDQVRARHFDTVRTHFAGMVRDRTGRNWTYNAVAP